MKEFRKINELFVCEECAKTFLNKQGISNHVNKKHNKKQYYDTWLKETGGDKCKVCENDLAFNFDKKGYYDNCCSVKCSHIFQTKITKEIHGDFGWNLGRESQRITIMKKFGKENVFQVKSVRDKGSVTKENRYGDRNYNNLPKHKITCLERYNDENYRNYEKIKQTCLLRYGVENPQQNIEIHEKTQKSARKLMQFNSNLWYQGTYELDFLTKYVHIYPEIQRGPSIKYGNRIYHPDFFIPSLNLIIEIKSTYTFNENDNKKKEATISNGFNYLMILDKNYTEFNSY